MPESPRSADRWVRMHRDTYDRMAVDYSRRIDGYAAADEADRFVRLLRNGRSGEPTIVDAGCGPGWDSTLLRLAGARLIGLDISRRMLIEAKTLEVELLVQGDLRKLPLRGASADGLWCFASLGHLPDPAAADAMAEFRRVLRPSGLLYGVVRQGQGVREAAWDGKLPRYFNDYDAPRLHALLTQHRFAVEETNVWDSATGLPWLHTIARAT